jgi:hypothetical protein
MPRRRRFGPPELPIHVRQRWNNRQAILVGDNGGRVYLDWLAEVRAHLAGMETDWGAVAGKPGTPDIGELVPTHASKRGPLGTDSFVELLRRRPGAPSSDPGPCLGLRGATAPPEALIVAGNGVSQTVPGLESLGRGCRPEAEEGPRSG